MKNLTTLASITLLGFSPSLSFAAPFSPVFKRDLPNFLEPAIEKKTTEQHWNETGLNLSHFFSDILPQCDVNFKGTNGCWAALETWVQLESPNSVLAFELEKQQLRPDLGKVKTLLGSEIALYERVPLEDTAAVLNKRKIRLNVLTQVFSSGQKISFKKMFESLPSTQLRKHPEKESLWSALLYNAFLAKTDDPHSRLIPMSEYRESLRSDGKNFKGLGLTFDTIPNKNSSPQTYRHWIHKVFAGSPADQAGLRMGDEVIAVHGLETRLFDRLALSKQLSAHDEVELKVRSRSGLERIVRGTRAEVHYPTVESKMLPPIPFRSRFSEASMASHKTGWIRIADFMDENMPDEFQKAYVRLLQNGAQGIIIDLQDNGGGLISNAATLGAFLTGVTLPIFGVSAASSNIDAPLSIDYFSLEGLILKNVPRHEHRSIKKELDQFPTDTRTPIVVLQNASSASASELLAGALQDHQRAWIVGDRSFGKGTVQGLAEFSFSTYRQDPSDPKIGFWKTRQRFHQPSGRSNQIQGIIPNFMVPVSTRAEEVANEDTDREEDVFEGAIPVVANPWHETRALRTSQIEQCRNALKFAEEQEEAEFSSSDLLQSLGYRVFSAQEILACDAIL